MQANDRSAQALGSAPQAGQVVWRWSLWRWRRAKVRTRWRSLPRASITASVAACVCLPRRGLPREYDVPCERTFRRLLGKVRSSATQRRAGGVDGGRGSGPAASGACGRQGGQKRPTGSGPFPGSAGRSDLGRALGSPSRTPKTQSRQSSDAGQLSDHRATPGRSGSGARDTNEEAAVATHLPKMDLAGVCLTADAAHTVKATDCGN